MLAPARFPWGPPQTRGNLWRKMANDEFLPWDQCTIGYAMKIKKKKMFKSKHLVFAHFSTKTGDFFGIDGKIPMFCHKYFLKSKM